MAAGREVQVFAVRRPCGVGVDLVALAQARDVSGREFLQVQVATAADGGHAERQPSAVRRKGLVVDLTELVLSDQPGRAAVGAHRPQSVRAVGEGERLAVGRENRAVQVAIGERGQHLLGTAFGGSSGDLRIAADIGGVGHRLAVGRPSRVVLVDARRGRQVARGAVLGRNAEDVAAGGKQRAPAIGRQREVDLLRGIGFADGILHVRDARSQARIVVGHRDRHFLQLLARQVEAPQLAALLERDRVAAEGREVHVVVGEVRDLARLAGRPVVDPQVGAAVRVLVAEVVDLRADPHRRRVGAAPMRDLFRLVCVEVVREDLLRLAAVVALPGAEVREDAVVGDGVAVGRVRRQPDRAVDGHARRGAAIDGHLVHVLDPGIPLVALRQEDHRFRIGRPGDHHVVGPVATAGAGLGRRMERQPPRRAACRRNHPHVRASLARLGVCNPASIGGYPGEHVLSRRAGQPQCGATGLRYRPEVPVRHEDDPITVGLGKARQRSGGGLCRQECGYKDGQRRQATAHAMTSRAKEIWKLTDCRWGRQSDVDRALKTHLERRAASTTDGEPGSGCARASAVDRQRLRRRRPDRTAEHRSGVRAPFAAYPPFGIVRCSAGAERQPPLATLTSAPNSGRPASA